MAGPTHGVGIGLTLGAQSLDYLAAGGSVVVAETATAVTLFWPDAVAQTPDTATLSIPMSRIAATDAATLTLAN